MYACVFCVFTFFIIEQQRMELDIELDVMMMINE